MSGSAMKRWQSVSLSGELLVEQRCLVDIRGGYSCASLQSWNHCFPPCCVFIS